MTQDEIIRMALEAGFVEYEIDDGTTDAFDVRYERFANLVAAAERKACAKVCEDASTPPAGEMLTDGQWASKILAGKIRARGNT